MTATDQWSPGEGIRHRFRVFERRTYLNSCSQGALSDVVREAYESYLGTLEEQGSLWEEWVDRAERLRRAYGRLLHADHGAPMLLDSYQAAGAVGIDVGALGVDFVVGGALKYLLGSPGVGYLYANPATTSHLVPTSTGWFADEDIYAMRIDAYRPAPTARRFESGTPPIPSVYAATAGVELMLEIGVERTAAHVRRLNDRLIAEVDDMGGIIATPRDPARRGPLIAIASTDAEQLVTRLGDDGIVTSSRAGNLRVSPHCYNVDDDIDRVLVALRKHSDLLRRP
jgi:selenocysteine lyase/cysteine desulfurase